MYNNTTSIYDLRLEYPSKALFDLAQIAARIGFFNFEWRYVTLVLFNIQHLLVIDAFLSKYNQSIILVKGRNISARRLHVSQYVLIGEQYSEISDTLMRLSESTFDRAGKFIIICSTVNSAQCDEKKIFQTLSELYVFNVILLKADNNARAYSYRIKQPKKCLNNEPFEINLDDCKNDSCLRSVYQEQLCNFHKCALIVSTFEQAPFMFLNNLTGEPSGSDGEVLNLLAETLNASLMIKTPSDGNDWGTYEHGNWTGSLGDVYNGEAYASMCSLPLSADLHGNFQISYPYNTMDIVWTAKLPTLKPAWEKLLHPLKSNTRFVLIFMFVMIIFLNALLKSRIWSNIIKVVNAASNEANLFFYSWVLFLGVPIFRIPTKRTFVAVVYMWIWFSFVIRSCYQAGLMDSLKHQSYERALANIEDAISNQYEYGGTESLRNYYSDDIDILEKWSTVNFSNIFDVLNEISYGNSDFALAVNKEVVIEYLKKFNGSRKLQIIPEKIVNSPSVIYFSKHSPLAEPVSHILSMFVEGGFIERINTKHTNYIKRRLYDHSSHQYEAMNLKYFAGTIGFLVLGWTLSIIFFIVEAYCGSLDKN